MSRNRMAQSAERRAYQIDGIGHREKRDQRSEVGDQRTEGRI